MNPSVTMSSLELVAFINASRKAGEAELTHANFLKKVSNVLNGDEVKFYSIYLDSMNREKPCYNFPKREACLMAMSYSYELQAKVFDKMTELENQLNKPKFKIPTTLPEALRLAADQAEKILKQAIELEQQKPAVEFVDNFVAIKSSKAISEVAKILGVGQREFFNWLSDSKIIYKRSDVWLPASAYAKYFDVKIKQISDEKEVSQTRFRPAGIVWIAGKWAKEKAQLSLEV